MQASQISFNIRNRPIAPSNTRNHISTPGITLQHSKSHFNIRNRTATLEITFRHSKSRSNTRNRAPTFEIALQHSKSRSNIRNATSTPEITNCSHSVALIPLGRATTRRHRPLRRHRTSQKTDRESERSQNSMQTSNFQCGHREGLQFWTHNRFENVFYAISPQLEIGVEKTAKIGRRQEKELLSLFGSDASLGENRKPSKARADGTLKFQKPQKLQILRFFIEETRPSYFGAQ